VYLLDVESDCVLMLESFATNMAGYEFIVSAVHLSNVLVQPSGVFEVASTVWTYFLANLCST